MGFDDKNLEIPETLPMLPVRDIVVFPYMILPLFVGREASIRSVEEALAKSRFIFLASQKEITEENPTEETIYQVGTIAREQGVGARLLAVIDGGRAIFAHGEQRSAEMAFDAIGEQADDEFGGQGEILRFGL